MTWTASWPRGRPSVFRLALATTAFLTATAPAEAGGEAGWTDAAPVAELRPTSQGRFLVRIPVEDNPSGCREPHWFYRDQTGPSADRIFDLLLEAALREKPVRVHVTGACDLKGFAAINAASLEP